MQATTMMDQTNPRGERAILDAAECLFSDNGFAGTSINQIARLANVSKANVFHHFSSKKELYLAVLRQVCDQSTGSLFVDYPKDGPTACHRLKDFVSSHLQGLLQNDRSTRLILREVTNADGSDGRELAEQVFAQYFDRLVKIVADGQEEDLLRRDFEPALLAYLLVGANSFFFQTRSVLPHLTEAPFAGDSEHFVLEMFEMLLTGVAQKSGRHAEGDIRGQR